MTSISKNISRFSSKEIDSVFKKANVFFKSSKLTILGASSKKLFGRILVITSRVVGCAPKRNRIRRRLKSIFYENEIFKKKYDLIVIIKKDGIDLPFSKLKEIMLTLF